MFHKLAQKYRTSILGLYLGSFATVVVHDYESVRQVLTRPEFQGRIKVPVFDMQTYNKNLGTCLPPTVIKLDLLTYIIADPSVRAV